MQSTAGETRRICYKGPISIKDKTSADRDEHANNFAKVAVPIYISMFFMMNSGTQQMLKSAIVSFSMFWHLKLPFSKLIRLWGHGHVTGCYVLSYVHDIPNLSFSIFGENCKIMF